MKIINQLTLRYLKQNKKRTILTILCITVSVIMISCVGIAFYSGKQFYKEYTEKTVGDYHYAFVTDNKDFLKIIENDNQIEEYYFSSTEPLYSDDQLKDKSYINLKRGDSLYFDKEDYQDLLLSGRLPNHHGEIMISENYLNINNFDKNIGDRISFYSESEKKEYTFLIVGIMSEYNSENYNKSSFGALSYIDLSNQSAYYSLYIRDKDVSKNIFEHGQKLNDQLNQLNNEIVGSLRYNSSYLAIQDIFEENSSSLFLGIYNIVALILGIIVIISLFIIYQAFNLSTHDRIQYLGMLSSVGATPKQKKRSVYFEGFLLSLISIPLGIILSFIGLLITFYFINHLETIKSLDITILPQISFFYLLLVIIISLVTIFLSLYLPARKIARISVKDALKKSDEIRMKTKKLETGFIAKKIFNISQQLASKNYKRQGKRSRVIVISLVISMVAFVAVYSFGNHFMDQMNKANQYNRYDIQMNIGYEKDFINETNKILNENDKVNDYYYMTDLNIYADINSYYLDIPLEVDKDTNKYGMTFIGLSENKRKQLCKDNNIEYKDNLMLAYNGEYGYYENDDYKIYDHRFKKMDKDFFKSIELIENSYDAQGDKSITNQQKLKLFDSIELIENDQFNNSYGNGNLDSSIYFIVPVEYVVNVETEYVPTITYNIFSTQHQELTKELNQLNYPPYDYAQTVLQNRQIFLIAQIFIYGFVFIMILFTMLNIINMMSASIDKRKKELGMMLSVGMSPKGVSKMLFYESFIYGMKTLLYGFPICIGIEWLFYDQIKTGQTIFIPSFIAYVIAFVVIMFIMLVTFRVGLNKFKKQNIIETLKDDM